MANELNCGAVILIDEDVPSDTELVVLFTANGVDYDLTISTAATAVVEEEEDGDDDEDQTNWIGVFLFMAAISVTVLTLFTNN